MAQAQVLHHQRSVNDYFLHDQGQQPIHTGYPYCPEVALPYQPVSNVRQHPSMAQSVTQHQYRHQQDCHQQDREWQTQQKMVPNYPSAGSAQPDYTLNGAGYPQHGFWGGASMYDAGAGFAVNRSPHLAQYSGSQYSSNSDLVYSPMAAQDGMGKSAFSYDGQPTWMSSASGMVPRGTGGTASDADTTYSTSPRSYSSEVLTLEIHPFTPGLVADQLSPSSPWSEFNAAPFAGIKGSASDGECASPAQKAHSVLEIKQSPESDYTGFTRTDSDLSVGQRYHVNGLPAYENAIQYGSDTSYSQDSSPSASPWLPPGHTMSLAAMPFRPRYPQPSAYNTSSYGPVGWNTTRPLDPSQTQLQARFPASRTVDAQAERKADDEILLDGKKNGLTYKEIRKKLHTKCAESTLRGRYRSLTKARKDRVRKPVWRRIDIALLNESVQHDLDRIDASHHQTLSYEQRLAKVQWKKIADYINNNGGSYHFGNSTCKRKWTELNQALLV